MPNKKILIPLPIYGSDPTEVAIVWKILSQNNCDITFITPNGAKATTDTLMLQGKSLGIWKPILRARNDAVIAHDEMIETGAFKNPLQYTGVDEKDYDAIYLPGGHDKAVKEYLESEVLQLLIANFFKSNKPVAAVCHGVVLVARSINPDTNKSVIHNYQTTCLLKSQEMSAYNMTRLWLKDYYLTYPGTTTEGEVRAVLSNQDNFKKGPTPFLKDNDKHMKRGFVVKDRNYISARWPGDIYNLSYGFLKMIEN